MARRIGDLEVIAAALGSIGTFELVEGDEAGWADLEEAAEVGRQAGAAELVDRALANLSECAVSTGRLRLALRYVDEMDLYSERSEIERCNADAGRSVIAFGLGDWAEAERLGRSATSAARLDPIDRAAALSVLVRLAIRRGDESWRPARDELVEVDRRMASAQVRLPLAALDAELAWILGEAPPPSVRLAYEEACETGERGMMGDIGIWLWRSGSIPSIDERAHLGHRLEVAGQAAEAGAHWDEKEMPYQAALARARSADPAVVSGAHAALLGLGATAVAARVALRLRELGAAVPRGPRATTRSNLAGLTERQAEIARLVAAGLSNAEIAERLVLSPRTVGHHVSAILAKLDGQRVASPK
jgi:DNA-binding CsgD family transcriptional regulator